MSFAGEAPFQEREEREVKAAIHDIHGGLDVLEIRDVPEPEPGLGEVVIDVVASCVNRLDLLQRQGPALLPAFSLPHIAGMDVAGVIASVGEGATGVAVGDRVLVNPALQCGTCDLCRSGDDSYCPYVRVVGASRPGGYAERVVVPATHVYAVPDHVDLVEAATVPTIWSTAWHALVVTAQLHVGETIVIHAANSGVSTAAIQLAKRSGATVIATARSEERLTVARKLGADVTVDLSTQDFQAVTREVTDGRGADVVFDTLGPALFQQSIEALRPRGRLVFCGTTTGAMATINLPYAYHFGISLLGADGYSYAEFGQMLRYYWAAGFEAVIDSEYPLDQVREAQRRLEEGGVSGKIVLRP